MLKIENFTKCYSNGFKAVDNLSLEVKDGEIYGFIGHNGAGKSTTIKSIVGILNFNKGNILVDNHSVKKDSMYCKSIIAYTPDNPDIYEHLTGMGYLNFIADIFNVDKETRDEKIDKYATLFEIKSSLGDYISSYSHGMKQKLVLISALIHSPKLWIMDEPFVGLDPIASHNLKELMKEFCKNGGAIFFSTHVLEVAEKLCDRVGIIKKGKLIAEGTVEEVTKNSSLEDVFLELEQNENTKQSH